MHTFIVQNIIFLTQSKAFTEGYNCCHNSENHNYIFFFLGGGGGGVKYFIIKQIIHNECIPRQNLINRGLIRLDIGIKKIRLAFVSADLCINSFYAF